ncbi:MAG: response regulator [Gammaproteobacteria bacterium]|nr:response regulator [Gammaproteobacteria bacterium]
MTNKSSTVPAKNDLAHQTSGLPQTEFDAILNSIPDVLIRFNLAEKVVWWNKNLEDVISLTQDKLLSCYFNDMFHSCDGIAITSLVENTINYGNAEIDAFLSTSEGDKRYHLKCTLIEGALEKEILVVGRDINERSQMSDALKQSQSQLQKLIDALPFLVFLTTTDNKYLLANKKFCEFVGLPANKIIGFKSKDIFNKNVNEYFTRDNKKILSDRCSVHYESSLDINRKNVSLSMEKFPLFDEENNIYAVCGVVENVTSQYQLQRQLQQTQKMEAIGQLTGGIAHDFNNVLASIMGYTGLTRRCAVKYNDETITGYLSQITRAGERARDLVQQLLAFSRGDVGGLQVLEPEPLAKEAIKMLTSLIPSSINLNLKIRNNNLKYYVEVDPVQFNQSVMNLVINSKDAIVDGSGTIDVSLEYLPKVRDVCDSCHSDFSGKYIRLSVTDSGVGMNKDIIRRIFDPFFTTKEIGKGSGMGLSMLHGIVHGSGGHIVVKSKTNHGTTINVYFPEVKENNIKEIDAEYIVEKQSNTNVGETILLIDDEKMITQYLSELLSNEGYKIISYNDSINGLKFFKNNHKNIDLIITDQTMPGLTGLELSKDILKSGFDIPVILCTGYSDLANDSANIDYGVDMFVDKPFDDQLLIENIFRLLQA